jgi:hypothetical protein
VSRLFSNDQIPSPSTAPTTPSRSSTQPNMHELNHGPMSIQTDLRTTAEESTRPIRALSLDGGGVRGMAELIQLKELQRLLIAEGFDPDRRPGEIFDNIGGCSTGGLIAIMIGLMNMSIPEIIDVYEDMSKRICSSAYLVRVSRYAFTGNLLCTSII